LQDVKGELFAVAGSGVYTGVPGQPAPRHVGDKTEAGQLADRYADAEPVRDFYRSLVAQAEANIRFDMALWEEQGDDA
jgi:hypothetical protein